MTPADIEALEARAPADRDIRSRYQFRSGCHIVIVEQYNHQDKTKEPEWKIVTNLFVSSEQVARHLAEIIRASWNEPQSGVLHALRERDAEIERLREAGKFAQRIETLTKLGSRLEYQTQLYAADICSAIRDAHPWNTLPDAEIDKAILIACAGRPAGAGDGGTYIMGTPTRASMRKAIEALTERLSTAALRERSEQEPGR